MPCHGSNHLPLIVPPIEALGECSPIMAPMLADQDPSLLLHQDFRAGTLDTARRKGPTFTFTRASSATYFDAEGVMQTAAVDEPLLAHHRYDGSSWINDGLLMEPSRTNLLLRSEEFDNAAWTTFNVTVVPDDAIAPDGQTTMDKLTSTNTSSGTSQVVTITANATFVISLFVKHIDNDWIRLNAANGANFIQAWFDINTGAKGASGTGGTGAVDDYDIEPMGDYYRIWLRGSVGSGATSITFQWFIQDGDSSVTESLNTAVHAWGAQLEEANSLSSYIPTVASQVTRALAALGTTDLSWYDEDIGITMLMTGIRLLDPATSSLQRLFEISDQSSSNRILAGQWTGDKLRTIVNAGGLGQADIQQGTFDPGTDHDIALRIVEDDFETCVDGTLSGSPDTSGSLPTNADVNDFVLGDAQSSAAAGVDGHWTLRGLEIYQGAKADTWLQRETA